MALLARLCAALLDRMPAIMPSRMLVYRCILWMLSYHEDRDQRMTHQSQTSDDVSWLATYAHKTYAVPML
jgi:hypothetical protein